MLTSHHKRFDPVLCDKSESISKTTFLRFADRLRFKGQTFPEGAFDFDGVLQTPQQSVFFELETRYNWKNGQQVFPFDTVNVPLRRARHLSDERRWMYAAVSADGQGMLILSHPHITLPTARQEYSENCYRQQGDEAFFKVPRYAFKWVLVP